MESAIYGPRPRKPGAPKQTFPALKLFLWCLLVTAGKMISYLSIHRRMGNAMLNGPFKPTKSCPGASYLSVLTRLPTS